MRPVLRREAAKAVVRRPVDEHTRPERVLIQRRPPLEVRMRRHRFEPPRFIQTLLPRGEAPLLVLTIRLPAGNGKHRQWDATTLDDSKPPQRVQRGLGKEPHIVRKVQRQPPIRAAHSVNRVVRANWRLTLYLSDDVW